MREIKFRGKRKDNGEWAYGGLLAFENMSLIVSGSVLISHDSTKPYSYLASDFWDEVIPETVPETVGQYTGLKDCKRTEEYPEGQEIYEGDIVEGYKPCRNSFRSGTITYRPMMFEIVCCGGREKIKRLHSMTVVGNIHSNPELMEK